MKFIDDQHRQYYDQADKKDCYHRALHYLIGLNPDTRRNAHNLVSWDGIEPGAIRAPWQTGDSRRVTRLAFNLYTDGTPTAHRFAPNGDSLPVNDDDLDECAYYSASDIFCCGYAPFFWEAIQIRYPEYCSE